MKKQILLTLALTLISTAAFAASISGSKHDMSFAGNTIKSTSGKTCEFCHAPHNAKVAVPLWNRNDPDTTGVTFYDSATLSTQGTGKASFTADSISLQCLSCHIEVNGAAANLGELAGTMSGNWTNGGFGTNLSNDHPTNIEYSSDGSRATNGGTPLVAIATVQASTDVKLFGASNNMLECSSCHKVHDPAIGKFLRSTNVASAMCKKCHTN